ncbi:Prophage PSPPH06 adenine modification methytransferase [Pseudomonas coronafaciens pv. garcae]|nr:Prophage PSPPH06 adenine modification methytransferase [Pseudomonas coronafaciens pv. garcae]
MDFPFDNYERMAEFMGRCKGKVMVSINDHPDIRRVFEGFHLEELSIQYTTANQRRNKSSISHELIIMNWKPDAFGGLF